MKKKIVFSVMGIIIVSSILLTIVSKNTKKTFMQDGVMFAVTLDGVSRDSFPSGNNYYVDINCENARGRWMRMPSTDGGNDDNYRLVIDDVTSNASCNVDFKTNPSTIKDTITGLITSGNIYEHQTEGVTDWVLENLTNEVYVDYSSAANVEQTGYTLTSEFYNTETFNSSTTSETSGSVNPPDVNLSWDSTNKYWISDLTQSSLTTARTYYYFFNVTEAGYYEVCYKKESGGSKNRLYLYNSSSYITASSTSEVCFKYGLLSTSDLIKIGHYTPASGTAKLDIYLKKGTEETANVGYRYEGKKPNNYIWFNNEMWRIIGVVPTCTSENCATKKDLVKIIRNESIGGLRWHTSAVNTWNNETSLYQVLNNYYLTKGNATGESICEGDAAADCDYRVKGIGETSYYGNMVENVYWNTGAGYQFETALVTYGKEILTQNVVGKIGIMNASDYGYATTTHSSALTEYRSYAATNWLYGQGYEWTITPISSSSSNAHYVYNTGNMFNSNVSNIGPAVRPVLYLKDSVYVVSGDGTESTPYQVAYGS